MSNMKGSVHVGIGECDEGFGFFGVRVSFKEVGIVPAAAPFVLELFVRAHETEVAPSNLLRVLLSAQQKIPKEPNTKKRNIK